LRSTKYDPSLNYAFKGDNKNKDRIESDMSVDELETKQNFGTKIKIRKNSSLASSIQSVESKSPEKRVDIENWNLEMYKKRMEN
jgi:hypothetical protein